MSQQPSQGLAVARAHGTVIPPEPQDLDETQNYDEKDEEN